MTNIESGHRGGCRSKKCRTRRGMGDDSPQGSHAVQFPASGVGTQVHLPLLGVTSVLCRTMPNEPGADRLSVEKYNRNHHTVRRAGIQIDLSRRFMKTNLIRLRMTWNSYAFRVRIRLQRCQRAQDTRSKLERSTSKPRALQISALLRNRPCTKVPDRTLPNVGHSSPGVLSPPKSSFDIAYDPFF